MKNLVGGAAGGSSRNSIPPSDAMPALQRAGQHSGPRSIR
jgi:hypothetical protein